jgi:hypothetical protein
MVNRCAAMSGQNHPFMEALMGTLHDLPPCRI